MKSLHKSNASVGGLVSGRALRGNSTRSNDQDTPTDSSVASGAVDEGRLGEPAAEGQADALTKALRNIFVTNMSLLSER